MDLLLQVNYLRNVKVLNYPFSDRNEKSYVIARLTALWALVEAGIGGFIHAFQLPFAGIFVGGLAVILISLIANFSKDPQKDILKATFVVLIIKAMVSPQSSIPAYLAVSFQGFLGAFLFGAFRKHYKVVAISFAVIALLESAVQKLLVLYVLFGKSLWSSIDLFSEFVVRNFGYTLDFQFSYLITIGYVALFLISGIIVGRIAGILPEELPKFKNQLRIMGHKNIYQAPIKLPTVKQKNKLFPYLFTGLLVIVLGSTFLLQPDGGATQGFLLILRTLACIAIWYLVLSKILKKLVLKLLKKKESRYAQEVDTTLAIIPHIKKLVPVAWKVAKLTKTFKRPTTFIFSLIYLTLTYEIKVQKRHTA